MGINNRLLQMASLALRQKAAFVAAGGDPSAGGGAPPGGMPPGGAPPMDPSMMGGMPPGMPPGGAPPMDPSMMGGMPPGMPPGGAPPMDPSMMGGGGGGGGSGDIRSAIRDELAAAGLVSQGKPGAGGKAPKADINTIATDVFQLKKMFLHFMRSQGQELPPDILDGPNRDPVTGASVAAQDGGSDPASAGAAPSDAAGPAGAIQPPSPIQPAFGGGPGGGMGGAGGGKTANYSLGTSIRLATTKTTTEASRLARLYAR